MKTKKSKIIAIMLLCFTMISMGIIQCFADNISELGKEPNDISDNKYTYGTQINSLTKLYIKIKVNVTYSVNDTQYNTINIGNNNTSYSFAIGYTNGRYRIGYYTTNTSFITSIFYLIIPPNTTNTIYVPLYIYNSKINNISSSTEFEILGIYYSILDDPNKIANELFQQGYNTGYNEGYQQGLTDYPTIRQDMNIVEHITVLISRFTGNKIAPYITPIAVVLTILMVYFLFIRFLLSLIKAKGIIKVCDIVMLVGCIIILVCMYLPFVNINITNHNINDSVETTQEVYTVRNDTEYESYVRVIENETGTLYISKYGDVFIPKETEEIYKINEDIETKRITP